MFNIEKAFSFELPTRIEYGVGIIKKLGDELAVKRCNRAVIITDKGIVKTGIIDEVADILKSSGIKYTIYDKVEANPKDYNVEKGAELVRRFNADSLLAVGGGSPIDCAKAIGVLATHEGSKIKEYEGKERVKNKILPLITIPTTAGTGSEVTFSSVITDTNNNYKMTIKSPLIAPEVALVDPQFTITMPPEVTASTGMDALTHAIEAYTVKQAEPISDALALYAVELINNNLNKAVLNGKDIKARAGMMLGSLLAGIAFSHSDVGSVHCMAEALGGLYDAPHGVCNSILLPFVMEYNMEYCIEKYARLCAVMGGKFKSKREGAQKCIELVKKLSEDIKIPDFNSLGVKAEDLDALAEMAENNISTLSNPRKMTKQDYLKVFKQAYNN